MKIITHKQQQKIWDAEHKNPKVLLQMHSDEVSGGVVRFWDFLKKKEVKNLKGVEIGCGKGRNTIWLAKHGIEMTGFDFSPFAVKEAKVRAIKTKNSKADFKIADATKKWPFSSSIFDFGIDCFASTDIESIKGRKFAAKEMYRVLKPGGFLMAYMLSPEDGFHREMIKKRPTKEKNAFLHDTGKFEKCFSAKETRDLYKLFKVLKGERVNKRTYFFGKEYPCKHHWFIFQKNKI